MNEYELPVVQLFGSETRRDLVQFALTTADPERQYTKSDLKDATDRSHTTIIKEIGRQDDDKLMAGPMVRFGIFEPGSPDARIVHYTIGDNSIIAYLRNCPTDIEEVIEVFDTPGRQQLISFFLDLAGNESHTKAAIERGADVSYQTVVDQITNLIDSGIVEEVKGLRGPEYQTADKPLVIWLRELNKRLVEQYNDTPRIIK
ncbi:helix-turn-helix domain-containing protein [Halapricum desulfuricans]|uniref:Uncharacterized protein n=1 Tax=Halapricum desulfuricans TaxID=2841257 RepID=A0A897NEY7_9EURY|nr:helix-turn-helix domain-containing protein [Halapricum desulfuricans]QSG09593.1 hypothetical protein HSR122_2212 [Halapricum desulfuricans]